MIVNSWKLHVPVANTKNTTVIAFQSKKVLTARVDNESLHLITEAGHTCSHLRKKENLILLHLLLPVIRG